MFSRFVLWALLVLVPFQSFAASGLIQCQPHGVQSSHVSGNVNLADHAPHAHEEHSYTAADEPLGSSAVHSSVSKQLSAGSHKAHHLHKSPCCSDVAIIFSDFLAAVPAREQFPTFVIPEADNLISVFLESPKRPPRIMTS